MNRRYDVCAAVVSDLTFDARVWKEARSLAAAGYRVVLIGCRYEIDTLTRRTEEGIDVVEVPLGSRTAPVSQLARARILLRLWWEILRMSARVYHAHNVETAAPAWLAARLRRARLVYDAHELFGEPDDQALLHRLLARLAGGAERFMLRRSDAVITTNRSRADVLTERHGRRDIELIGNVPLLAPEVDPLDPGYPAGRRILLYQGHISAEARSFRETVQALTMVEDLEFVIIGFARQERIDLVRRWAEEEGVSSRVHFLPPRPFDELVRTAAGATIGLVPIKPTTLNNRLGDTNKLFEYLMAGLPVVASDLPEIARVAREGRPPVGEVFDPESAESIAAAIRRVLEDPDYEGRRLEARRLAVERYNWQVEEKRLLALYEPLCAAPAATNGSV